MDRKNFPPGPGKTGPGAAGALSQHVTPATGSPWIPKAPAGSPALGLIDCELIRGPCGSVTWSPGHRLPGHGIPGAGFICMRYTRAMGIRLQGFAGILDPIVNANHSYLHSTYAGLDHVTRSTWPHCRQSTRIDTLTRWAPDNPMQPAGLSAPR